MMSMILAGFIGAVLALTFQRFPWRRLYIDASGQLGSFAAPILSASRLRALLLDVGPTIPAGNPIVGSNPAIAGTVDASMTETVNAVLSWTQGGTLVAPQSFLPLKIQPRDPAKAPFEALIAGGLFNATWDAVLSLGYNTDFQHADAALIDAWEQDYEVSPGVHWFERYTQYTSADKTKTFRPWYFNVDKSTNVGGMIFALPGPVLQGSISFTSGDGTQNYLTLTNAGFVMRNNFIFYVNDNAATPRPMMSVNAANQAVLGDFFWARTFVIGTIVDIYANGSLKFSADAEGLKMSPPAAVPAAPVAGTFTWFIDPADSRLKVIGSAGTVTPIAAP